MKTIHERSSWVSAVIATVFHGCRFFLILGAPKTITPPPSSSSSFRKKSAEDERAGSEASVYLHIVFTTSPSTSNGGRVLGWFHISRTSRRNANALAVDARVLCCGCMLTFNCFQRFKVFYSRLVQDEVVGTLIMNDYSMMSLIYGPVNAFAGIIGAEQTSFVMIRRGTSISKSLAFDILPTPYEVGRRERVDETQMHWLLMLVSCAAVACSLPTFNCFQRFKVFYSRLHPSRLRLRLRMKEKGC
jgi:hypothetical protein